MKYQLKCAEKSIGLTFEKFYTFKAVLNSKPVTSFSNLPQGSDALKNGDFLIGTLHINRLQRCKTLLEMVVSRASTLPAKTKQANGGFKAMYQI